MKEKYTDTKPAGKKLSNEGIFFINVQRIKEKIRQLAELEQLVLLSQKEGERLQRVQQQVGSLFTDVLAGVFTQKRGNEKLVDLAKTLNAEIRFLEKKLEEKNSKIELMVLAAMQETAKREQRELEEKAAQAAQAAQEKEENLNKLTKNLFDALLERAENFTDDVKARGELEALVRSYYDDLQELVGHDLGKDDFEKTIAEFLEYKASINTDKWIKMLGILLYADILRTPGGGNQFMRGNGYLSKKVLCSDVANLTDENIVAIFQAGFCDDAAKQKFKEDLNKENLKDSDIILAFYNSFEVVIFPHMGVLDPRPENISSDRCQRLAEMIQESVFPKGKEQEEEGSASILSLETEGSSSTAERGASLPLSKEEEKEEKKEAQNGVDSSIVEQKLKQNSEEVSSLTAATENLRESAESSPSTRLTFSSEFLSFGSPIVSRKIHSPSPLCTVDAKQEERTDNRNTIPLQIG